MSDVLQLAREAGATIVVSKVFSKMLSERVIFPTDAALSAFRDAVLEEAAKKAASFATCPCNGDRGRCMENDPPLAIAAAIRAMKGQP